MAIRGNLREASLADVLQLLALGRKTGCLSVSDRNSFGQIYFDHGAITHASIVNRRDRLGDMLVKNGLLSPEELEAAVQEQDRPNSPRIGEILVARGAISREALQRFIRVQIEEAVYFLFTWTQGTFYFESDERPPSTETLVAINPESVLLEGARRVDEWTLIEKKIPSPDIVFRLDYTHGDPAAEDLTADQRRIIPLLDGRRSVAEIVDHSGLMEFEASKAIYGLAQAGYARPIGRRKVRPAELPRPGRLQEHYNLGIAFMRTRMFDEAEREFLRILELDPENLEAQFQLGVIELRRGRPREAARRFMTMIEEGGRWPSAFQNLTLALESGDRLEQALLVVEDALGTFAGDHRLLLSRAILLTRLGKFGAARRAFDAYRGASAGKVPHPACYYAYSMVALAGSGEIAEARLRVDEGLEQHPRSAPLLVNAATVLERSGASDEAEELYRRASEEKPDLLQAQRGLADALYRRGAYEEAGKIYERLARAGGAGVADLNFRLGNIAYKAGDRTAAVRYWRATVEADPNHAIARTNLELVSGASR
jgi:tetratricopeptide (TPR) repeat protein